MTALPPQRIAGIRMARIRSSRSCSKSATNSGVRLLVIFSRNVPTLESFDGEVKHRNSAELVDCDLAQPTGRSQFSCSEYWFCTISAPGLQASPISHFHAAQFKGKL